MERPSEPPHEKLSAALIDVPGVEVRVLQRCTSTNSMLLAEKSPGRSCSPPRSRPRAAAGAAGAGKRGGRRVTFSLSCPVRRPLRELAALSLVAGVGRGAALRALGVGAGSR